MGDAGGPVVTSFKTKLNSFGGGSRRRSSTSPGSRFGRRLNSASARQFLVAAGVPVARLPAWRLKPALPKASSSLAALTQEIEMRVVKISLASSLHRTDHIPVTEQITLHVEIVPSNRKIGSALYFILKQAARCLNQVCSRIRVRSTFIPRDIQCVTVWPCSVFTAVVSVTR